MTPLNDLIAFLDELAPAELAEGWDNVGLLIGDRGVHVSRVTTCLTLTPDVAAEAVRDGTGLIVTHHPVLFRAVQRVTADDAQGRTLLQLIAAGVAVYSPHTRWDSAPAGINRQLAELLSLQDVAPLRPIEGDPSGGAGRFGRLPQALPLSELIDVVKDRLGIEHAQFAGDPHRLVKSLAVACGSAAEFLADAIRCGCQALLTGEARFHACLEARELDCGLILAGHHATERFAVERLAELIAERFPGLDVKASGVERDPVQWAV